MVKQAAKTKPTQGSAHFYVDWAKERLDEVDATLTSLDSKVDELRGDARAKADGALADMRARRDALRKAMQKDSQTNEATFAQAKAAMEGEWNAFETSVQHYVDAAGQQAEQQKAAFRARVDAQTKAWREAADKQRKAAAGFAAERKADVEAAVKRMNTDAVAAQVKLDKLGDAGIASWSALTTALTETRNAFERANQAVYDAFKHV